MCFLRKYLYPSNEGALGIPGGKGALPFNSLSYRPYYGEIFVMFTFKSVDEILMVLPFK